MENVTKEVLDGLQSTFATKSDVQNELSKVQETLKLHATSDDIQKLENILVEQGNKINELSQPQVAPAETKSYYDQVVNAIETQKEAFNQFASKQKPFNFELVSKVAGTMTIGTNVTGSTTLLPTPQMIAGYNPYRWNPATFLDYATLGTTTSARISYVDEVNPDGTPTVVAENNLKPTIDKDDNVSVSDAVKIAAVMNISDEMLADIPFMATQINNNLLNRVRLATSGNFYTYINSVKGLSAVNSGLAGLAGTAANLWQLVVAAQQTLKLANHTCTHIFVNPIDYARLLMLKGQAEIAIIVTPTGMSVNGVEIVSTNSIAADAYLACDYSKFNTLVYKNLGVEMGWAGDDFTYNRKTFRAEWRLHRFIMENDKNAFLIGSVSADLTTLSL